MSSKKYWVWLSMVFGGGTNRLWQLFSYYENVREFCNELLTVSDGSRLTKRDMQNIKSYNFKDAEALIGECERKGVSIVSYDDSDYPRHLRYISDPPPVLYCMGNTSCLTGTKTITSVGTRSASDYSISVCRKICSELAKRNFVIASGFAIGIDITSHLAAAESGKPTICVLAGGVDVDYPKENCKFRDIILQSGGVFISEYPPATKPIPANFPRRNRILSAIGKAAMVFEASFKSGSLITAKLAAEQGHEVFVLPPGDIFSPAYGGNIGLIKEGAIPLMSADDIDAFFHNDLSVSAEINNDAFAYAAAELLSGRNMPSRHHLAVGSIFGSENSGTDEYDEENEVAAAELISVKNLSIKTAEEKLAMVHSLSAETVENPEKPEKSFEEFEGLKREIVEILYKRGRLHADIICEELSADSAEIMTELTELELLGTVKVCPGRIYELTE